VIVRNYAHREIRHRSYSELQSRIEPLRFINHVEDKSISTTAIPLLANMAVVTPVPQPTSIIRFVVTLQDQASEGVQDLWIRRGDTSRPVDWWRCAVKRGSRI
jgi:hypothetical protein